ncbi:hypothetical protein ASE74_09935 [Pedobacter sp. Leaf216]|uniref:hypothetical protein n=1 Tax=Pedobacter sp. Leaf216 TaxID=1735684 RepID=UPI0006FCB55F|nr:hypothetical protein [Pedobacter sp. Leaf216]KQM66194.1 hypothetical protein ASE74_09935 [Pedobacter sp. Leaf216]
MNNLNAEDNWHHHLSIALANNQIECCYFLKDGFHLLQLNHHIIIHLVSLQNPFSAGKLIQLQEIYAINNIKLVHLWEDLWLSRPVLVLARIKSLLGKNVRIYGRKTKIFKVTKPEADEFLNQNHLQGSVSSRYKFGLFEKEELVAVATFSALRKMNHSENYRSAELIRFAVKAGYSITGGLSKLISHFLETYKPNDLMTYADRDWSAGEAYTKLGFEQTDILEPMVYLLDENLKRLIKKDYQTARQEVFNTGSIKFILWF